MKFLSNCSSLPGFFKFWTVSDNHPFLTTLDLTLSLLRFELAFWLLNWLSELNEENKLYNFLILLKEIFIVPEFGIIEEAYNTFLHSCCLLPINEISVKLQFAAGLFQILNGFRQSPFFDNPRFNPQFVEVRTCVLIA